MHINRETASPFLSLPALRGFWPMSIPIGSVPNMPHVVLNKTPNYQGYDGSLYNTRNGFSSPGITVGCWVRHNDLAGTQTYMAKYDTPSSCSWFMGKDNYNRLTFTISSDGTSRTTLLGEVMVEATWTFVAGIVNFGEAMHVFSSEPNPPQVTAETLKTSQEIWKTSQEITETSIYDTDAQLSIGSMNGGDYLNGQTCLCFLCEVALTDYVINDLISDTKSLFEA